MRVPLVVVIALSLTLLTACSEPSTDTSPAGTSPDGASRAAKPSADPAPTAGEAAAEAPAVAKPAPGDLKTVVLDVSGMT